MSRSATFFLILILTISMTVPCFAAEKEIDTYDSPKAYQQGPTDGDEYVPDHEMWDDTGEALTELKREGAAAAAPTAVPDPLEGWNRFWFDFNDVLYFYAMKPAAQGYKYVVPEKPREWFNNFFHNLLFPVRFVNCLLQGKVLEAGAETSRFIANTAFGLGGLSDFAYDLEPVTPLRSTEEDLGQTFGAWGIGNGMYLVWPVLGPSSARDTVGYVGDMFLSPTYWVEPWYAAVGINAFSKVNEMSFRIGEYEAMREGALDPYAAIRNAYIRYRQKQVED